MAFTHISHALYLSLAFVLATGPLVGCGDRSAANGPGAQIEQKLKAPDWHTRQRLAVELARNRSPGAFKALLQLLNDPHEDVRYAAAEALEIRADIDHTQAFTQAIAQLPREKRWSAYRALRNYPSAETFRFLVSSLAEELEYYRNGQVFDDRNCHYIASSIEELAGKLPALRGAIKAPTEGHRQDFDQFLVQAKSALARISPLPNPK